MPINKRLERTRHEQASLLSCAGEPLKRSVRHLMLREKRMKATIQIITAIVLTIVIYVGLSLHLIPSLFSDGEHVRAFATVPRETHKNLTAYPSIGSRPDEGRQVRRTGMRPKISMITLGVSDLKRAIEFYQGGLGLPRMDFGGGCCFLHSERHLARTVFERIACQGCDRVSKRFGFHRRHAFAQCLHKS
jgi:hypothetical protein